MVGDGGMEWRWMTNHMKKKSRSEGDFASFSVRLNGAEMTVVCFD